MSIFREMHEARVFESPRDYAELRRMLNEAIERGYVERIPAIRLNRFALHREWYREKETGEIYALVAPVDGRNGSWARVDPEDLVDPNETVQ